jgi:hypothetical protein
MKSTLHDLIKDMEKAIEAFTKWLRGSGLVKNQTKTKLYASFIKKKRYSSNYLEYGTSQNCVQK